MIDFSLWLTIFIWNYLILSSWLLMLQVIWKEFDFDFGRVVNQIFIFMAFTFYLKKNWLIESFNATRLILLISLLFQDISAKYCAWAEKRSFFNFFRFFFISSDRVKYQFPKINKNCLFRSFESTIFGLERFLVITRAFSYWISYLLVRKFLKSAQNILE